MVRPEPYSDSHQSFIGKEGSICINHNGSLVVK